MDEKTKEIYEKIKSNIKEFSKDFKKFITSDYGLLSLLSIIGALHFSDAYLLALPPLVLAYYLDKIEARELEKLKRKSKTNELSHIV